MAGDIWSVRALTPLFPKLYEARSDLSVAPDLAAALPAISADGLTWTVRLRKAQWSPDGRPITAADVVYTVKTEMDSTLASTARFDWSPLASVEAAGSRTVVFELKRPDAAFLGDQLTMAVVPSHELAATPPRDMAAALYSTQPSVAGGPFQLEVRVPGQSIDLEPNKRYYGGAPYLGGVQIQVIGSSSALADQLTQGLVGWAPDISTAAAAALGGAPNVTLRRFPELGRFALVFNERSGRPFADAAIRRNIAAGIDRRRVAAAAGGVAVWSDFNAASWAYDATASTGAQPEHETAGRLLYPLGDASRARAAAELVRELPGLTPDAVPPGDFQQRLAAGDFDVALAGLGEGVDPDPATAVASWETPASNPLGENFGAYADRAVDGLVQRDLQLDPSDHAARKAVLRDLERQLDADPPFVDLWTVDEIDAFSSTLAGVGAVGPQLDQDLQSSFYARWSLAA